jgi:hypothetical protein
VVLLFQFRALLSQRDALFYFHTALISKGLIPRRRILTPYLNNFLSSFQLRLARGREALSQQSKPTFNPSNEYE